MLAAITRHEEVRTGVAVSALVLAGLAQASDEWPRVVAKFDGNGWAAAGILVTILLLAITMCWTAWDLGGLIVSKPSDFEGWAAVRDNMVAGGRWLVRAGGCGRPRLGLPRVRGGVPIARVIRRSGTGRPRCR